MNINENAIPISDKRALINLAVHTVDEMRKIGRTNDEIENILLNFQFSYPLIGQIMY